MSDLLPHLLCFRFEFVLPFFKKEPIRKKMRETKGVFLFAFGLGLLLLAHGIKQQATTQTGEDFGQRLMMVVFCGLGFLLIRHYASKVLNTGRKSFTLKADDALLLDNRPPILFLRSFSDDERCLVSTFHPMNVLYGRFRSLEEILAKGLHSYGPLVAIGRPGEPEPPVGAYRAYVPHDRWKVDVCQMMESSQMIILQLGASPGLGWEIQRLFEGGFMEKVVITIPPYSNDEMWMRWQLFVQLVEDSTSIRFSGFPGEDSLFAYLGSGSEFRFLGLPRFSRTWISRTFRDHAGCYIKGIEILAANNVVNREGLSVKQRAPASAGVVFNANSSHALSPLYENSLLCPGSVGKRVLSGAIDFVVGILLVSLFLVLSQLFFGRVIVEQASESDPVSTVEFAAEPALSKSSPSTDEDGIVSAICMAAGCACMAVVEWKTGGSPGKFLVRLRVVNRRGGAISFGQSIFRNVLKYGLYLFAPVSVITMCSTGLHLSIHDVLSRTVVVDRSRSGLGNPGRGNSTFSISGR